MKKFGKMIIVILLLLSAVSCSAQKPSDVVNNYLNSIKQNVSKVVSEETIDSTDGGQKILDIITESMDDFDYEILNEEIDGDEAVVKVKITTYGYGTAIVNTYRDFLSQAFALALGGASEEMLQSMLYEVFAEKVQEEIDKGKTYTGTVSIVLTKQDGKWAVPEEVSSELQNAIMGNMLKMIESME